MSDTPFKMKYTNGKKASPSAFPFSIMSGALSALTAGANEPDKLEDEPIKKTPTPKTSANLDVSSETDISVNTDLINLLQEQDIKGKEVEQAITNRAGSAATLK